MANTDDLIREAMRNGEDYLRTQMQIALAADQRAISLGGILAAAASVVLGFLFTDTDRLTDALSYVCLFLSIGLGIASGLAFYAARPVPMKSIGNTPSNWYEDIKNERPLSEAILEEVHYIDKSIIENTIIIEKNAEFFKFAMITAAATVVISALAGVVFAIF